MIMIIIIVILFQDKLMLLSDSACSPQGVEDFVDPYEDMLMLWSDSEYLSKGVVDLLIPYEDKLMWLPHLKYSSEGVVDFWPLMKIWLSEGVADVDLLWRQVGVIILFNIFVTGGGFFDPVWRWVDVITPFNVFVRGGAVDFLIPFEDKLMWLHNSTYLPEGVVDLLSLMKISWCDYTIQHICHRGWRIYDPFWI